jgi:hypothetical protein
VWGAEHLIVAVDNSGVIMGRNSNTPAVTAVINALTATMNGPATMSSDAGSDLTETQIGSIIDLISAPTGNGGVVPTCAMEVSRTSEVGALSSYSSPYPCICRYESKASPTGGVQSHACTTCAADTDCADAGTFTHCRYGYCEAN